MRIIEGNTGVVRIEIDGSLPPGASRQIAFQRFVGYTDRVEADGGVVIDPEATYNYYKIEVTQ